MGSLEQFNYNRVAGWVFADSPDQHVALIFNDEFVVDCPLGPIRAKASATSRARYAFSLPLPEHLESSYPLRVRAVAPDGTEFSRSREIETRPSELAKVLRGKGNWLFMQHDSNASLDLLTGKCSLPKDHAVEWVQLFEQRRLQSTSQRLLYTQLLVPEKEVVYQEFLPVDYTISAERPVQQILDKLNDTPLSKHVIYPTFGNKDESDQLLYYRGDSHWTYAGALQTYNELIAYLEQNHGLEQGHTCDPEDFQYRDEFQAGDLISKLDGVNIEPIMFPVLRVPSAVQLFTSGHPRSNRIEMYHNSSRKGRILAVHTSSMDWMKLYINHCFGECLYLWQAAVDWRLVNWFQPDILLCQTNERFLTRVPTDKPDQVFNKP
jgi:hypothetical protein